MKKNILRAIIFSIIFLVLYLGINTLFKFKYDEGIKQTDGLYAQKENTIDVLFTGSSASYVNFNPALLYKEYGIASYCFGADTQRMWNTYYYIVEALKKQSPKVIVLEVYTLGNIDENYDYVRTIKSTEGMKFSQNKIDNIYASAPKGKRLDLLLGFPTYHSRYEELTKIDFNYKVAASYKGNHTLFNSVPMQKPLPVPQDEYIDIAPKTYEYFIKIIELCKQEGIELVVLKAPGIQSDFENYVYNSVDLVTKSYNVPFLNYNYMYDKLNLDFSKDFADYVHLTYSGSEKLNKDFGKYLKKNYDLPNRQGVQGYESWDENLEIFQAECKENILKNTKDINEYFNLLDNENYINIIMLNAIGIPPKTQKGGIINEETAQKSNYDYLLVTNGNTTVYENTKNGIIKCNLNVDGVNVEAITKGMASGNTSGISVANERIILNNTGLNVVVYDKILNKIIDTVCFDVFYEKNEPLRQ